MMQKYNESIYPILYYLNESILIILNDQNVSMTKGSKNMASFKKCVPVAQLVRVRGKLTRVDHLTKSDENPCEINNNLENKSFTNSHIYFHEVNFNNIKSN